MYITRVVVVLYRAGVVHWWVFIRVNMIVFIRTSLCTHNAHNTSIQIFNPLLPMPNHFFATLVPKGGGLPKPPAVLPQETL